MTGPHSKGFIKRLRPHSFHSVDVNASHTRMKQEVNAGDDDDSVNGPVGVNCVLLCTVRQM